MVAEQQALRWLFSQQRMLAETLLLLLPHLRLRILPRLLLAPGQTTQPFNVMEQGTLPHVMHGFLHKAALQQAMRAAAVTWSNNFTALSPICGATGSATVIFTAADACGNTATTSATFTIQDNTVLF